MKQTFGSLLCMYLYIEFFVFCFLGCVSYSHLSDAKDIYLLSVVVDTGLNISSENLTQLYWRERERDTLWIGLKGVDTRHEMFAGVSARVRSPRRTRSRQ
jgi:hypothetical protein